MSKRSDRELLSDIRLAIQRISTYIADSIPWKSMSATRDRLIHDYFGVNLDIVWQIAKIELPKLSNQLADIDIN